MLQIPRKSDQKKMYHIYVIKCVYYVCYVSSLIADQFTRQMKLKNQNAWF